MSSKQTRKALFSSFWALLLCFAMLLGTTFAWFTDTASTSVNKIQAGNLKIELGMYDDEGNWTNYEGKTLTWVKADNGEEVLWEPGCSYALEPVMIRNNGNLALQFKVDVTGIKGSAKLNEAIEWTVDVDHATAYDAVGSETINTVYYLLPGECTSLVIGGHMKEEAGNEYQGLSIDGVAITVYATQWTYESDSFGNDYDAGATLPSLVASDIKADSSWRDEEPADGIYHIASAAQFLDFMNTQRNSNTNWNGKEIFLDCDIDFGGMNILGVSNGDNYFAGDFDGQGHTVSNFQINRAGRTHAGLFNTCAKGSYTTGSLKNLTVKDAVVIGKSMVGAVVGGADNGFVIENCHAVNCTVIGTKKVGAVVGYIAPGFRDANSGVTVSGCSAKDISVYCGENDGNNSDGKILGYNNQNDNVKNTVTNNTSENVDVYTGVAPTLVSTAADLANALDPKGNAGNQPARTIILTADIDGSSWTAISGGSNYHAVTIVGNGHTIRNLAQPLFSCLPARDFVFENINFTNVNISSANNAGLGVIVGEAMANGGGSYTIANCHINGGKLYSGADNDRDGKYVGAFIGYINGGNTDVAFANCSVTDVALNTFKSVGGFIGSCMTAITVDFEGCAVKGNTSVTARENRAGSTAVAGKLVGTLSGTTATVKNCTVDSSVTLSNTGAEPIENGFFGRSINGSSYTVN